MTEDPKETEEQCAAGELATLEDLGWDSGWEEKLRAYPGPLIPGRVVAEDKHSFGVFTAEGEVKALLSGKSLRRAESKDLPKIGDWVLLERGERDKRWKIGKVLPRKTRLARKHAGREVEEQVLAANIDLIFAVQPLDQRFNMRLLERHLVMAMDGGADPVILLNKADLCEDLETRLSETRLVAGKTPIEIVSARTGLGLGRVRRYLKAGTTAVFLGSSGVGKSSLVNRLYGEKIQSTREVRESDHRGRHSTCWKEMILLRGGGVVIDTPGLREFHLWTASEGLQLAFPELETIALQCRFRDCSHTVEGKCAVKTAVEAGLLPRERYESYVKLKAESQAVKVGIRREKFAGGPRRKPLSEDPWRKGG